MSNATPRRAWRPTKAGSPTPTLSPLPPPRSRYPSRKSERQPTVPPTPRKALQPSSVRTAETSSIPFAPPPCTKTMLPTVHSSKMSEIGKDHGSTPKKKKTASKLASAKPSKSVLPSDCSTDRRWEKSMSEDQMPYGCSICSTPTAGTNSKSDLADTVSCSTSRA